MPTNDFLVFGGAGGANVIAQVTYSGLAARTSGFSSGVANSAQLNKVWRQSSIMSAILGQFIVDLTGLDALDDGTTTTLLANLKSAVALQAPGRLIGVRVFSTPGTSTYTPTAGTTSVVVEVLAGCGGSGGVAATSASQVAVAGGGGGGGYGRTRLTSGFSGVTVTVGAKGAAGAAGANNGTSGTASSFGAAVTASGGLGGGGGIAVATTSNTITPSGAGGGCSGGSIVNASGGIGFPGIILGTNITGGAPGTAGNGQAGAGAGRSNAVSAAAQTGLDGTDGRVVVWEYA